MSHERGLFSLADAIDKGNVREAEGNLASLLEAVRRDDDPRAVGYYVFGAALARRLSKDAAEEANLYLTRFDVPQIHLFNLLAHEVPQVGLTTVIANRCIAGAIEDSAHPTVIDVGIGTARQMTSLLELLAELGKLPAKMTLIGVEPSAPSLELAEKNVAAAAQRLGIRVDFHPFTNVAENISRSEWAAIADLCQDRPVINASFALHHIGDVDGSDIRNDILLRLRSLNPRALVLSEPNVHHLERSFSKRFANCWEHFGETFRVLDALPITQADKDALKVCFFGREIADILGNPEDRRSERHESTESWLGRLGDTGFVSRVEVPLPASGPVISVTARDGYVTLDHGAMPLVSVLSAIPIDATVDVQGALARAPVTSVHQGTVTELDVGFYLSALHAVARADTVTHERESAFIEEQARVLGLSLDSFNDVDLETVLARAHTVSDETRMTVLRDLLLLARIDGHYDDSERTALEAIADRFGVSRAALRTLENQIHLPPVLGGTPSWFRKLWFMAGK